MSYLSKDDWIGSILSIPTYRVKYELAMNAAIATESRGSFPVTAAIEEIRREEERCFFYVKVPSNAIPSIGLFESIGFRLIDTNVTLKRKISGEKACSEIDRSFTVGPAQAGDLEGVGELAASSFEFSRFHLDPQISKGMAQQIKREWARNYFLGRRGDHMLVCRYNGMVAGFVLLLQPSDGELVIDLIAVDSSFRGKGVGGSMLEYVFGNFPTAKEITVGTQVCNIPSLALYQKCNFYITSSSYVLHGHFKADGKT